MDESSTFSSCKTEKNKNQEGAQAFFQKNLNFFEFFAARWRAQANSGFWRGFVDWRILWFWGVCRFKKRSEMA